MGDTDSMRRSAPPPLAQPYLTGPVATPASINYFRFTPQEAGWTSVASFGTASVWHQARDLLTHSRIVCRMVADPTKTRTEDQRIELLVMASEAEWAREILRRGISELAGNALPPGGFPVVPRVVPQASLASVGAPPLPERFFRRENVQPQLVQPAQPLRVIPMPVAALPVAPLGPAPSPGQSVRFTVTLIVLFALLILLIISMIAVCFMPTGYTTY